MPAEYVIILVGKMKLMSNWTNKNPTRASLVGFSIPYKVDQTF